MKKIIIILFILIAVISTVCVGLTLKRKSVQLANAQTKIQEETQKELQEEPEEIAPPPYIKVLNFKDRPNVITKSDEILYKYFLNEFDLTPEKAKNLFNITPDVVETFEVDLNDDGTNEIIGVIHSTFCWGTMGYSIFILQKNNNGTYSDLSFMINFESLKPVYILKSKTNGYHDIMLYGSSYYNFKSFITQYKNNAYIIEEQIRDFENALRQ